LVPGVTAPGPLLLIDRSALAVTAVDAVEELLAEAGSAVVDEVAAVFCNVDGAA
jgi:hypothetical protein